MFFLFFWGKRADSKATPMAMIESADDMVEWRLKILHLAFSTHSHTGSTGPTKKTRVRKKSPPDFVDFGASATQRHTSSSIKITAGYSHIQTWMVKLKPNFGDVFVCALCMLFKRNETTAQKKRVTESQRENRRQRNTRTYPACVSQYSQQFVPLKIVKQSHTQKKRVHAVIYRKGVTMLLHNHRCSHSVLSPKNYKQKKNATIKTVSPWKYSHLITDDWQ